MSELSEPNVRVRFRNAAGDTRWIDFAAPTEALDGSGLSELLLDFEGWANANEPIGWPVGIPSGPWTVQDWERTPELEAELRTVRPEEEL